MSFPNLPPSCPCTSAGFDFSPLCFSCSDRDFALSQMVRSLALLLLFLLSLLSFLSTLSVLSSLSSLFALSSLFLLSFLSFLASLVILAFLLAQLAAGCRLQCMAEGEDLYAMLGGAGLQVQRCLCSTARYRSLPCFLMFPLPFCTPRSAAPASKPLLPHHLHFCWPAADSHAAKH